MNANNSAPLMVIGAGISGLTTALEAAEAGREVLLVEREPSIGGRVLRNHQYFPKLCPPGCGIEINVRRLERNPRLAVRTNSRVTKAERKGSGWSVTVETAPAYVTDRCTACGDCAKACPVKVPDPYNLGMSEVTAIHLPHGQAWPRRYTLNRSACPAGCDACVKACKFDAIQLDAEAKSVTVEVAAMVVATGWHPYPLDKLPELGGGKYPNVIANVTMERLVAKTGPTDGKIVRPSDGQPPKKVAFVQCAGSRDVNHLPYCSAVCCLASLKQALYVREQLPDCEVTIYYIDRRAPGRNEDMLQRVAAMDGVKLVKGKVGRIDEQAGGGLVLRVEDVESGRLLEAEADLVVLATGMVPNVREDAMPGLQLDEDGFGLDDFDNKVLVAGVTRRPEDVASSVRDATGAAAKAFVAAGRGA